MINEALMAPGSFEVTLREDTPVSVRRSVPYQVTVGGVQRPFGHICVTPARLPQQDLTRANVVGAARFSGRISQRSNRMRTFGGNHIAVSLGTSDGIGHWWSTLTALGASTSHNWEWSEWITDLFDGDGTWHGRGNGILEGTNYTAGDTGKHRDTLVDLTPRDALDPIRADLGFEWRVTAQGYFESGNQADLFGLTPSVIVLRGIEGTDTPDGVRTVSGLSATTLDVDENFDSYTDEVHVTGQNVTAFAGQSTTIPFGFDGATTAGAISAQSSTTTTTASAQIEADAYLAKWNTSQQEITCRVAGFDVRRLVQPGDNIYLFDEATGLYDPTATPLNFLGRVMNPIAVRLQGINWPVTAGMGVYSIQTQDGSGTVVDLTDWVEWETGDTELIIGDRALTIREGVRGDRKLK